MRKEILLATDGHTALLRNGKIAVIGFLHEGGFRITQSGGVVPVTIVELDFEGTGKKDLWYFEANKLAYNCLSQTPSNVVRKIYQDVTKVPGCDLNTFLVTVSHTYAAEMVFGDAFKE